MKRIFRNTIIASILILSCAKLFSQQQVQFSQFYTDYVYQNPAFAGRAYQTDAAIIHRQQWVGLAGAPVTTLASVNTKISPLNLGLGLSVYNDQIGNFTNTGFRLAIASEKRLGTGAIRFGLAPSFYSYSLNTSFSAIDDNGQDPILLEAGNSAVAFDLNVGFMYKTNAYFVGLSAINLLSSRVNELKVTNSRTIHLVAGYDIKNTPLKNVTLHPTVLVKTDLQNTSGVTVDVNALALYKKAFFAGVGFRTGDAFFPILGYQWFSSLGKFRLGYSYDYTINEISNVSNGTHEISLTYSNFISRPNVVDRYKNVRFL